MTLLSVRRLATALAVLSLMSLALAAPHRAAPPREQPGALTSRPRLAPPAEKALAVGGEVTTGPGERRRVRLPEGSTLYVNQKTTVRLTARNQLTLAAGEVFLDAAPSKKGEGLVVKALKRRITSQGTKFAVRADKGGTSVVVASGRVEVSGLEAPVRSGQLLAADASAPAPAPRVSHLLGWVRDLMPAGLVPTSQHAGGALVARDPNGQEAKLALRRYHVDVFVEDGFARTTIDQTYFNHSTEQLEGTFYFPLPPDASLSRLAMYVDGVRMEGGMAERDHARTVYETIRYAQRDPALLEWVDGSTFKMRVFPLEGRKEKRLLLSYTQKLPALYGRQSYRFPAGHSLGTVAAWSFHARIKDGANLSYASPSHTFKMTKSGADLLLDASAKEARLDRDVVLDISEAPVARADEVVRFSSIEQDGAKYLMVRYRPALRAEAARQRRDWVFLVETSGDRDPLLARTQIEVVRALLDSAEPDDTFALLTANTRTRALSPTAQEVTPENVAKAIAFLEGAHLIGALDLGRALSDARPFLEAGRSPYLVHVGSGVASMGEKRDDALARRLPKGARYVGVGVGRRWGRALMKVAAERTAGHFTQINPDESVAWRGFDLAATLNTPRLLDVKVVDRAGRATFLPFVSAVAQGEEVTAVARVQGELPKAVVVKGTLEGKEVNRELAVKDVKEKAGYLPRTWARLEIERLLAADARANKEKVIALSKAMYVMTPFTSLLVLESEEMYTQYKVDRGRKDHWAMYPAPEKIKVVYEPVDGEPVGKGKPSARQVARTVLVRGLPGGLVPLNAAERAVALRRLAAMERMRTYVRGGVSDDEYFGVKMAVSGLPRESEGRIIRLPDGTLGTDWDGDGKAAFSPARARLATGRSRGNDLSKQELGLNDSVGLNYNVDRIEELSVPTAPAPIMPLALAGVPDERMMRGGIALNAGHLRDFQHSSAGDALLHERPSFSGDARLFADLLRFAPGLNTSSADARAVLEAEARFSAASKRGTIDAGARALFAKARPSGWRSLTVPAQGERPAFTVLFDAAGRYRYERKLSSSLRERVVCDGTTLWHAYPDLGLAARRAVSRFHRLDLAHLVPHFLPAPEDLARGADLRSLDADTVALVPHGAASAKGADGKPRPYRQVQFVFADGRLAERQVVEMPGRKLLLRETYAADGTVKRFGGDGKEIVTLASALKAAEAPELKPDLRRLVVLELPFRTREHLVKTLKLEKTANASLRFADARALLASEVAAGNAPQALALFKEALLARGQKDIGYYVLLAAAGVNLDSDNGDVLGEHPEEPLAHYLALHSSPVLRRHAAQWAAGSKVFPDGLLERLTTGHALTQRWSAPANKSAPRPATRPAERARALAFVKRYPHDPLAWALLGLMQDRTAEAAEAKFDARAAYKALAEAWGPFATDPGLGRVARYEQARCLFKAGDEAAARKLFRSLYAKALKEKGLLRIDGDFVEALRGDASWAALVRQTAAALVKEKKRGAALVLAQQCWQLGEQALAQHVHGVALADLPDDKERLPLQMAGLRFLMSTGQLAEADRALRKLLSDSVHAKRADLWRLGAQLAEQRSQAARQLACLEKALELEHADLPATINLERVRADYGQLLEHYGKLADALVTLELPAPAGFRAKVVGAADRWRALDSNSERACELAANVLRALGERELAWDYLTTPAAQRPNEAEPWVGMAQSLKRFGELPLADRAYQAAFEAEPTNAEVLWDRAQNLRQMGRLAQARVLYRQLADGDWQPRFRGLADQARWALER